MRKSGELKDSDDIFADGRPTNAQFNGELSFRSSARARQAERQAARHPLPRRPAGVSLTHEFVEAAQDMEQPQCTSAILARGRLKRFQMVNRIVQIRRNIPAGGIVYGLGTVRLNLL